MSNDSWKACIGCGQDTRNRCGICTKCLGGSKEQEKKLREKKEPIEEDRDYCVNLDIQQAMQDATG